MTQNIYDDQAFFAGYATLDRSTKGLYGGARVGKSSGHPSAAGG